MREQFIMLLIDKEAALAAIPSMLPADAETRRKAFDLISEVLSARGEIVGRGQEATGRVARLFGVDDESAGPTPLSPDRQGSSGRKRRSAVQRTTRSTERRTIMSAERQ